MKKKNHIPMLILGIALLAGTASTQLVARPSSNIGPVMATISWCYNALGTISYNQVSAGAYTSGKYFENARYHLWVANSWVSAGYNAPN